MGADDAATGIFFLYEMIKAAIVYNAFIIISYGFLDIDSFLRISIFFNTIFVKYVIINQKSKHKIIKAYK